MSAETKTQTSDEPINFPAMFPIEERTLKFLAGKDMLFFSIPIMEMMDRISSRNYANLCMAVLTTLYTVEKIVVHFNGLAPSDGGSMILDEVKRIFDGLENTVVNKSGCPSMRKELDEELERFQAAAFKTKEMAGAKGYYNQVSKHLLHLFGFCQEKNHDEDGKHGTTNLGDALKEVLKGMKRAMEDMGREKE